MENTIHTVNELLSTLKKYQCQFGKTYRENGFIFRGVSDKSWQLLPGLFREYKEPQNSSTIISASYSGRIYSSNEIEILAHFKKEAIGFLPHISLDDDFTWLQYAQHFGVPTRLLDFTSNPLIALYFCCRSESKADGIIWMVNASPFQTWSENEMFCAILGPDCTRDAMISSIMQSIKGYSDDDKERLEKYRPVLFTPAFIDQRMSAQSSRFLLWGKDDKPLESMIDEKNVMTLSPDGITYEVTNDKRFFANIIISGESKHSLMWELDLLGVNEKTVFPGLDGIGRYIERYYKENIDDLCNFI
ncbi:MAG TPA: FRG domain-containing protein [Clostridiales bacterium]|nr:FRG domain-containing protein [Clostridiales bacterium]